MQRRRFNQLLTWSAGAPPILAGTEAGDAAEADAPQPAEAVAGLQAVTVEDYIALAKAKLSAATFDYITTGSGDQITLHENVAAFQRLHVYPPLMKGVSAADISTTALGQKINLPVILAPVAAQRMYRAHGGLGAARAAAAAGTIYGVSSSVGHSVEEIASSGWLLVLWVYGRLKSFSSKPWRIARASSTMSQGLVKYR